MEKCHECQSFVTINMYIYIYIYIYIYASSLISKEGTWIEGESEKGADELHNLYLVLFINYNLNTQVEKK
jgi:hypothetical protein